LNYVNEATSHHADLKLEILDWLDEHCVDWDFKRIVTKHDEITKDTAKGAILASSIRAPYGTITMVNSTRLIRAEDPVSTEDRAKHNTIMTHHLVTTETYIDFQRDNDAVHFKLRWWQ
jgi:hypothetical protein